MKIWKGLSQCGRGIIMNFLEWAATIHNWVVLKSDSKCLGLREFLYDHWLYVKLDRYPIPKVEDLFMYLKKGKLLTKLDLINTYQQLTLDAVRNPSHTGVCSEEDLRALEVYTALIIRLNSKPKSTSVNSWCHYCHTWVSWGHCFLHQMNFKTWKMYTCPQVLKVTVAIGDELLLTYLITPRTPTNVLPAKLLLKQDHVLD